MIQSPKVQIVILQYNNSEDTIKCLEAIKNLKYPNFEVVVVDNASAPDHLETIKSWSNRQSDAKYKILNTKQNLGYSGGNNLGIKYALENSADYVLILNNDTILESNVLDKLIKTAQFDPKIGVISPLIDEGVKKVYGGKIKWLSSELEHINNSRYAIFDLQSYIPGTCVLIKKEVFKKVGLLDEKYFLYFEDADYSVRIQKAGFKLAVVSDAVVRHLVSSSTKKLGTSQLLYFHYRNALYFNLKNGPLYVKFLVWPWSVTIAVKQILKIIFKIKPEHSRAILKGVRDFYKINLPI